MQCLKRLEIHTAVLRSTCQLNYVRKQVFEGNCITGIGPLLAMLVNWLFIYEWKYRWFDSMNEYSYFTFLPLPSMLMRPSVLKFKVTHKEGTDFFYLWAIRPSERIPSPNYPSSLFSSMPLLLTNGWWPGDGHLIAK